MKIIVIGAGAVGLHLARTLSWEGHEIVIIDNVQELVDRTTSSMDVLALRGSGTSAKVLVDAGAHNADLLLAVTSVDEVNIVACMLAKQLNVKQCIARVRNQEYSSHDAPVKLAQLGIDQVIHPELEAAREVVQLIKFPYAIDLVPCTGGKMLMVGVRIEQDAEVAGKKLFELTPTFPQMPFRVVALLREGKTTIPRGKDQLRHNDVVYVMAKREDVQRVFKLAGKPDNALKNVMLLGGGMIGRMVAELLEAEKDYNIKLLESDVERSQRAVQRLKQTMVVKTREGIDFDTLAIEGIGEMGVFAALTDDDENNIVTSLFSRHLKVKRTITRITKPEYMPIAKAIGLEAAINERILTSDAIIKYLLGGRIMAMSSLRGIEAEIIEFAIKPDSRIAGKLVRDVGFPPGSLVGAIENAGVVGVALGDTMILPGSRLVVFCEPKSVPKLEKLLH